MARVALLVALAIATLSVVHGHIFPVFPFGSTFTTDVSAWPLDAESTQTINYLNGVGWGSGALKTDFSFHILRADCNTPRVAVVQNSGYYLPDCEDVATFPLPVGGAIEGSTNYQCDWANNDCHLLVADVSNNLLYESYQSNINAAGKLESTCIVIWDLNRVYPSTLRGEQCSSCDAAGFPISPLLFTADEIAAGVINHAIRFILPNARMRTRTYVHPASHAGAPSALATTFAPIYGTRFRLKASYDITGFAAGARVVLTALKKYGMLLSDGGNIALTAQDDTYTTAKWADVGFTSQTLISIPPSAFEVVQALDSGTRVTLTYDCVRNFATPYRNCSSGSTGSSQSTSTGTTTGTVTGTATGTTTGTTGTRTSSSTARASTTTTSTATSTARSSTSIGTGTGTSSARVSSTGSASTSTRRSSSSSSTAGSSTRVSSSTNVGSITGTGSTRETGVDGSTTNTNTGTTTTGASTSSASISTGGNVTGVTGAGLSAAHSATSAINLVVLALVACATAVAAAHT